MTILDKIIDQKKTELPGLLAQTPSFNVIEKTRPSLYDTLIKPTSFKSLRK